jgi:hypothetical protein
MTKNSISVVMQKIFFLTSIFCVTVFSTFGRSMTFLFFFFVLLSFFVKHDDKILLFSEDRYVIYLFYLCFFSSFAVISFFSIFIYRMPYIEFYPSIIGRITNITIFFVMFVYILNKKNHNIFSTNDMLNAYLAGCYILLFFGIWQLLSNLFGVPYPDWSTRSSIHSMDKFKLLPFMTMRITSIAREPAFLMPCLIDAIILIFYNSKKYILIFSLLTIIFFSLSLSGYINIIFILMAMFSFLQQSRVKIIFGIILTSVALYMGYQLHGVFATVFSRLTPDNLLLSSRFQTIILSIKFMFSDISPFNILFGFGPKGMEYIRRSVFYTSGYFQGNPIETTTHFIFIDFFVEHGIFGIILLIILFSYLLKIGKITYKITKNRLSQVLCLNLFISSLYTADYASPRFTIIMIFILCLYKDAIFSKRTLGNLCLT